MNTLTGKKIPSINFAEAGSSRQIFPNPAILTSHHTDWTNLSLEYHLQPECDTGEHSTPIHLISLCFPTVLNPAERWLDGHFQKELLRQGDTLILPAGALHRCLWRHEGPFIVLGIEPILLERVGEDVVNTDCIQLIPHAPPLQDPLLQGIALALKDELETGGGGGRLYVDQLKTTLAMYLLRKYASHQPHLQGYEDGLPGYKLNQVLDYIQAHLDQTIRLADLAQAVGMSQYYFCRLFRQSMGMPPHKYLIQQRVERAKQLLRQNRQRAIADIALECGFANQSHLAKHFRQLTGATPKAYRRRSYIRHFP